MTVLTLAGRIETALSHLALVGLAAIIEDRTGSRPRLNWSEQAPARPQLTSTLTSTEIAVAVRSHAEEHTYPNSWVNLPAADGARSGHNLFTVRAPMPASTQEWQDLAALRRAVFESGHRPGTGPGAVPTRLDLRMIVALGEPAWWLDGHKPRRPDDGASRWEMKTRNRGEEFLRDRLADLARAVAARSPQEVCDGLLGRVTRDEPGRNDADSRTSTGLTTPGPTDSAVAWCALWGISAAPTIHRTPSDGRSAGMSQSPGTWPRRRVHPVRFAVPVFTLPTTVGRWAAVLISRDFDLVLRELDDPDLANPARAWLREQGIRAVVEFPTQVVGSQNAPERRLLAGQTHTL